MATNFKNSVYHYVSGSQSVPASAAGSGTVVTDTNGSVVGTGTSFLSEMPAGSWLVDLSSSEVRKVKSVESDTLAYLYQDFTTSLAGVQPDIIHERDTNIVTISVSIPSGEADGAIDGELFPAGQTATFSKDSRTTRGTGDYIDPIIVEADVMLVLISK